MCVFVTAGVHTPQGLSGGQRTVLAGGPRPPSTWLAAVTLTDLCQISSLQRYDTGNQLLLLPQRTHLQGHLLPEGGVCVGEGAGHPDAHSNACGNSRLTWGTCWLPPTQASSLARDPDTCWRKKSTMFLKLARMLSPHLGKA